MKTIFTSMLVVFLLAGVAFSHSGAVGIVKKRMDAMKDMSDKTKIVSAMIKGKTEFNKAAFIDAADAFVMHGNEMSELFPDTVDSRTGSQTEALPKIWQQWGDFNEAVMDFVSISEGLVETVSNTDSEDELKQAFLGAAKSCRSCHKLYRKPK